MDLNFISAFVIYVVSSFCVSEYIDQLMDHLLANRTINKSYLQVRRARALFEPARPPPLAQSTPVRPHKEEVVNKHLSRFST